MSKILLLNLINKSYIIYKLSKFENKQNLLRTMLFLHIQKYVYIINNLKQIPSIC